MEREKYKGQKDPDIPPKYIRGDDEWKRSLTPEQFRVMRLKGTEPPFTGIYDDFYEKGIFECSACGNDLFSSDTKFKSGSGWPSFYAPIDKQRISTREDRSHGMYRTEVLCASCESHLGHVFPDGPQPTGLRYCINSHSLHYVKEKQ